MAIHILQKVFGHDRPILILIDELSKAGETLSSGLNSIIRQVEELLDAYDNLDVVVSSLAPSSYISDLLNGSVRPIQFVVLDSLQSSMLGIEECQGG